MKRLSLPRTINPHAKHFTDSVSNVLYSMEKFESRALAWPTCKGASRKKKELGSRQDCSFPEVPLAQSPSSLYPFQQSRPRGWWENSSQVREKNTFYQILQENQDREMLQMSKAYPHTHLNVPLMPVYHPIQNGINIRNMSYTTRPPNDEKVYTKQKDPAEKIPSLGVNPIHRVKRLPPVIDVPRNTSKMQRRPSGKRKAPTSATASNEPRFMLSYSSKKAETRPNSIRTLTQHKKSTENPRQKTPSKSSKPSRLSLKGRSRKHPDTISISRSRRSLKSDTGSIATAILDEIVVAERQSLLPARSLTEVKPYEQRLPDNQNDQGEQRRSTIRENRSRMELFNNNKKEDTPRASYEEQLNRFRELLEANTSTQNYNNEIDIEQIVPADVLNYPYPMLPEDTPKVDPSMQTKTKINAKQNVDARKTEPPLQQQVAPKKHECCICQALHRHRTKDAPFIVEMRREQKRQELLAYRTKMLAANPSLSAGMWCKTLDSYDQLIHQQVS